MRLKAVFMKIKKNLPKKKILMFKVLFDRDGWYGWEEVQRAGVQYTLDTVVTELYYNPERKLDTF